MSAREFREELAHVIWLLVIFGVVFLFYGDPDVWDRLHDRAMGVLPKCVPDSASAEQK